MISYGSTTGRWILTATILGSGIVFIDGTVVNVALPAIGHSLHASLAGLQWTIDGYLLTLSALLLIGGGLGDRYGRRLIFVIGLGVFTVGSLACALAPDIAALIAARALQGLGGAMLVPGSMAIIAASIDPDDRGRAIGAWSGLSGVAGAVGPFLGGWLIDAVSWRMIFVINLPLAAITGLLAWRHVPESRAQVSGPLDVPGAATASVALATLAYASIEHRGSGSLVTLIVGVLTTTLFLILEARRPFPMLPLSTFRSPQFSGTNLTTVAVYGALGVALFLVVLRLEISLGYSALLAGVSLVPFTGLMLVLSPRMGRLGQRVGARLPMTVGSLVTAVGMLLFGRVGPGTHYVIGVLPAVVVFGLGMSLVVAPLTAAVLGSVPESMVGVASGINNAASRLASLFAVAVLPGLAGISVSTSVGTGLSHGYVTAMRISAGMCAVGAAVAWVFVKTTATVRVPPHPSPVAACQDPRAVQITR
ncbi:MAG TPA: MFS transporter [Acidimicrobiales bacterium]|nr:MFS transporter [Acidimicrobiales bacterium]